MTSAERWVRRAMLVFGMVGVLVIGRELWRFHAGPETLDDAAPVDAVGAEPLIRPEMRSDPRASAHPIRLDPTMPADPVRPITLGAVDGAVERCVIDGNVVYVSPAECRGGVSARQPATATMQPQSAADGLLPNQQEALRSLDAAAKAPPATPAPARAER
ncbi:hypothetical protein [Piscinibacter koreensis]|uniref:Uncharacterized protein n=1 Tax=Piscinibacter koreensis TaxID=2742824 RepID=A0A7Y6NJP1_9BURK|nr:hypothetical protein [Schlegelella koreensis]NUZ04423.1 hypothetical protein [Schlegelella koreensis]